MRITIVAATLALSACIVTPPKRRPDPPPKNLYCRPVAVTPEGEDLLVCLRDDNSVGWITRPRPATVGVPPLLAKPK